MANIKRANTSGITKSGAAISDVPDAPTIGAVTDLLSGSTASVAYTAAIRGGAATTFTATSSPGGLTGTGSSPITVSGLSSGTAYTFTVTASNTTGSSPVSNASGSLTLASLGAFESISSLTTSGGPSSITFSSIPSTYKSLQLRGIYKDKNQGTNGSQVLTFGFNSTTSTYSWHSLRANGTTVSAGAESSTQPTTTYSEPMNGNGLLNIFGAFIMDVIDYSSTSKNKTLRMFDGSVGNGSTTFSVGIESGAWYSTSAVSSINITSGSTGFADGTVFALYGVK